MGREEGGDGGLHGTQRNDGGIYQRLLQLIPERDAILSPAMIRRLIETRTSLQISACTHTHWK